MIVNMCTRSAGGIGWYPPSFDNRPRTLILGEKTIMRTGLDDSDQWTVGKDLSPLRFVRDDPVPHGDLHPPVDPDVVVDDAICLLLCNGGDHATTWSKRGGITERVRVVSVASSRVLLVRRSSEHLITGQQQIPFSPAEDIDTARVRLSVQVSVHKGKQVEIDRIVEEGMHQRGSG